MLEATCRLAAADEDVDDHLLELQELAERILSVHERRAIVAAIQQLEAALAPPQERGQPHGR